MKYRLEGTEWASGHSSCLTQFSGAGGHMLLTAQSRPGSENQNPAHDKSLGHC